MYANLSNYIPLVLLFTISISSKKPFLEHEIVPIIHQPTPPILNKITERSLWVAEITTLKMIQFMHFFSSNKIFAFQSYDLPQDRKVFAAFDDSFMPEFCLVAEKKAHGNLAIIAHVENHLNPFSVNTLSLSDNLDCILKAQNSNCFQTFYFQVFDFLFKYQQCVHNSRWLNFILKFIWRCDFIYICPCRSLPVKILCLIFRLPFLYIASFPLYHAKMIPLYILSFPFEFFLFQYNFIISGMITKTFVCFWTLPSAFMCISEVLFFNLQNGVRIDGLESHLKYQNIKPKKIQQAVPYFMEQKYLSEFSTSRQVLEMLLNFLLIFVFGFIYTIPFLPFMIIHGEANE